jgi:biopolymer transport protein ExbD
MRIPCREFASDLSPSMTPMISVMLLLFLFFFLFGHLTKPGPLEMPAGATVSDGGGQLTVQVLADGTILVAGRHARPAELAEFLGPWRSTHGDGLQVRIRADRSVPYALVEPVMLACQQAGIGNVTIDLTRKESQRTEEPTNQN